ncbi:hypothetical protein F7725_016763, partial [Dissostichus mawsoni]
RSSANRAGRQRSADDRPFCDSPEHTDGQSAPAGTRLEKTLRINETQGKKRNLPLSAQATGSWHPTHSNLSIRPAAPADSTKNKSSVIIIMNTLNQQYEEKVRPCIDLIDSLRSLGVEKDLALPAIAVIGDQSSGKSSVLEALSGVALPRGSGIVTRCPLELKMKRKKEGEAWYGKISYQSFEREICTEIDDPVDVEKKIREAQDELAGQGVGISDDLISLEIASPDVPDLTLIDLPGITRVAVKGQDANIGDKIKSMIQKFIRRQETISLVVVPCNVDIATTEALKMAQEVDPEGERTLGILTKPDLVDRGTEENVVEIVNNEVIHLKKGYMIVKCRVRRRSQRKCLLLKR